ncbi:hypothetical protein NEMBOFW57_005865 [Staphylotrichum longicolle]|uniref:Uncharacterized protein n=1 Tax=Staphylotrichum longicolle TaxID=669026 RepID=A0AAD4EYB5_9PEZI|nr:hypothetical protein NEMBOFW57_005865 [Staphylotrichum longicolle]
MLSDAPNSSWHPALMPNSTADLPQTQPEDATSSPAQEHSVAEDLLPDDTPVHPVAADEEAGAWFQDDGTTAGDDWLADTSNAPPAASTDEDGQPAPAQPAEDAQPDESNTASKHFSTMSFTRTALEVNFNDDDDTEWSLPRTNTDPFKFMPENNRTNSFPLVSPLEHETAETDETPRELEHPISFNQAEDLIREIEEESREEEGLPDARAGGLQGDYAARDPGHDSSSNQFIGGSVSAAAEEPVDSRFEEGLPLVSSTQQDGTHQPAVAGEHDLFAENAAAEEDDFFSSVRRDEIAQEEDFQPPPVERKSTLAVLQAMNMEPAGAGFPPLEETAEESEAHDETPQPQEVNGSPDQSAESQQDQPIAAEGENLDAKWEAMFGEDDDVDFLPDEGAEANELDASAFLGSDDEGLLEDSETEQPEPSMPVASPGYAPVPYPATQPSSGQYLPRNQESAATTPSANPYLPAAASPVTPVTPVTPAAPSNPYLPTAPVLAAQPPVASPYAAPPTAPPAPAQYGYGAPPPLQEKTKAQSFVDKARGGYTSPYDLPMEVVKPPKRRTTAQPLQSQPAGPNSPAAIPPPPRSASMYSHPPPPSSAPAPSTARPASSHSSQGASSGAAACV